MLVTSKKKFSKIPILQVLGSNGHFPNPCPQSIGPTDPYPPHLALLFLSMFASKKMCVGFLTPD